MKQQPKGALPKLLRIALFALPSVATRNSTHRQGVPNFSWDKIPTYIHCQNKSGPLAAAVAARFARRAAFVTIEKEHAQAVAYGGAPPQYGVERKMQAQGKALKALNPSLPVIMYYAADFARRWYDMGVWFDAHPSLELACNNTLILGSKPNPDGKIGPWDNPWHVVDFAQPAAVQRWVRTVTDSVATGNIDGAFVDGMLADRGGAMGGWTGRFLNGGGWQHAKCNESHQAKFLDGLNASQELLRQHLGPERIVFANLVPMRPGDNAIMIEGFHPDNTGLAELQALAPTLVAVHSYDGSDSFNTTLAGFLLAAQENAYLGTGMTGTNDAPWECSTWDAGLMRPEFEKALGAPLGNMSNSTPTNFTRVFASGTSVWLDTRAVQVPPSSSQLSVDPIRSRSADVRLCNISGNWWATATEQAGTKYGPIEAGDSEPSGTETFFWDNNPNFRTQNWNKINGTVNADTGAISLDYWCTVSASSNFSCISTLRGTRTGSFHGDCNHLTLGTGHDWHRVGYHPLHPHPPSPTPPVPPPPPPPTPQQKVILSCIRWADGSTTGNACE